MSKLGWERRRFLQGSFAGLALPMLESALPAAPVARDVHAAARLVCIGTYLGFHQDSFYPRTTGDRYQLPTLLTPLADHRASMTIFSGLDHRGRNGHGGWQAWMTGGAKGSESLDGLVARELGEATRFASLQITCGNPPANARISFTKEGVALPMIGRPSVFYQTLFRGDSDKRRIAYLLRSNRSVLDSLLESSKTLSATLPATDKQKFHEYLAAVRDVERQLQKRQKWLDHRVPKVDYPLPEFDPVAPDLALQCESIMYDLMSLALTTDSTRVLTFLVPGWSQVFTVGGRKLSAGYHGLSHHGNDPQKIAEYNLVGREHVKRFANFVTKLTTHRDHQGRPLLDSTLLVYGSGMGDSNTHDNSNLPTLVVGGGLQHGHHHHIDRQRAPEKKLGGLYLSLLRRLGIEREAFAGTRTNLHELLL